jgi:hypothetical protein
VGLSARETVEIVHQRGGLAIAAHPYFPICSLGDLAARLPFDGFEVANGTILGELGNRLAVRRLGASAGAAVGGSDAHLLAAVGHVRTHFHGRTAADLRVAIERGTTWPAFDWDTHLRIAPADLLRMAGQMVRNRVQPRRQVTEAADGKVGVRGDRQATSLVDDLHGLPGAQAHRHVAIDEDRQQVTVGGGDLGADHHLGPAPAQELADPQRTLHRVVVGDRRDRQVAPRQPVRDLRRSGRSVAQRGVDVQVGPPDAQLGHWAGAYRGAPSAW